MAARPQLRRTSTTSVQGEPAGLPVGADTRSPSYLSQRPPLDSAASDSHLLNMEPVRFLGTPDTRSPSSVSQSLRLEPEGPAPRVRIPLEAMPVVSCSTARAHAVSPDYRYATANARFAQRQLRRQISRKQRGLATPTITGVIMTPAAASYRSAEIPLYVVHATQLSPRTTTRVYVRTATGCAIPGLVFCHTYPALQQVCLVCNGIWQGDAEEIPLLVTNFANKTRHLGAAMLLALAEPQIGTLVMAPPLSRGGRGEPTV